MKNNTQKCIEQIQKFFINNQGAHTSELIHSLKEYPAGTLSCNVSFMERTGHLIRLEKGRYETPDKVYSPDIIIKDINKLQKQTREAKKKAKSAVGHSSVKHWEQLFQNEAIKKAVDLLKSNGYKVLKQITEFKEI